MLKQILIISLILSFMVAGIVYNQSINQSNALTVNKSDIKAVNTNQITNTTHKKVSTKKDTSKKSVKKSVKNQINYETAPDDTPQDEDGLKTEMDYYNYGNPLYN